MCGPLTHILRETPETGYSASDGPTAFRRFCHCLRSFHQRLWIQKWLVHFPFPCSYQHTCLISGLNVKTSRLEFSSLLEIKGSPHHYVGFSVLVLNKASPAPPRASGRTSQRQGGKGRNSSFLNMATHGADEREGQEGLYVFLK